jgi:hypothetical protein
LFLRQFNCASVGERKNFDRVRFVCDTMIYWTTKRIFSKLHHHNVLNYQTIFSIRTFAWRDWVKPRETWLRILAIPAEIVMGQLSNRRQTRYRLSWLVDWYYCHRRRCHYYYYHRHHHHLSFMQGIYTYIPETNHVPREHIVAAILSLLFMVLIFPVPALALLYFYISTFRCMFIIIIIIIICCYLSTELPLSAHMKKLMRRTEFFASNLSWHYTLSLQLTFYMPMHSCEATSRCAQRFVIYGYINMDIHSWTFNRAP